jgi:hypothetical protein
VVEAVNHLKVRSCLIDGEVVCCDEQGVAAFQLLRHRRNEPKAHQALRMPSSTAVFNQLSTTISYLEGTAESASLNLMRLRSRVPLEG